MSKGYKDYRNRLVVHSKAGLAAVISVGASLILVGGLVAGHFAYKAAHPVEVEKCVVSFIAKPGTFKDGKDMKTLQIEKGKKINKDIAPIPFRDECTFSCWCTDEKREKPYNFNSTVNSSFSLYAKWDVPPTKDGVGYVKNSDGKSYAAYCVYPEQLPSRIKIPKTHKEKDDIKELPVTSIGQYDPETEINYSFEGCENLTTVEFEENSNVTYIDYGAFSGCTNLKSITMPDKLTSINKYAFEGCSSLSTVTFNKNLLEINEGAFSNCVSLNEVTLPDDLLKLENNVFYNCSNLTTINIKDKLISIGDETFNNCTKLSNVSIPCSTLKIGVNAFNNCKLTYFELKDTYSNWQDSSAKEITRDDVKDALLAGTEIFKKEFLNTEKTLGFYYLGNNCCSVRKGEVAFPEGKVVIPNYITISSVNLDVVAIADYAFKDDSTVKEVTIPQSVSLIGNNAFQMCGNLSKINFGNSNKLISIGDFAFQSCWNLKSLSLPEGLLSLGDGAFYFSGIENVTLPKTIKEIKNTTITTKDITTVYSPFHGCHSLTSINVTDGATYYKSIDGVLYSLNNTEIHTLVKYPEAKELTTGSKYTIEDGVKVIGTGAFYGVKKINSIEIPNSVIEISDIAFSSDERESNLISVSFTNVESSSLIYIGVESFANCKFTEIDLPKNLITIGNKAFKNCNKIKNIVLPSSVSIIGPESFSGCNTTLKVTFENESSQNPSTWTICKPNGEVITNDYEPNKDWYKTLDYLKQNYYWFKEIL